MILIPRLVGLLAMAQVIPAGAVPSRVVDMPPTDWNALPELVLGFGTETPPTAFVHAEVVAGRCRAESAENHWRVVSPVIVLFDGTRIMRQIVPRAIGCVAIEQYTVGYVSRLMRGAAAPTPGWYRLAVTYTWPK